MIEKLLVTSVEAIASMVIVGGFLSFFWVINNLPSIAKEWNAWRRKRKGKS